MLPMETKAFGDWLQDVLDERGWTRADLARAADVRESSLSDVFSGRRKVGTDLATAIADALKIPQEDVYIAAGLLRPKKSRNAIIEQMIHEVQERSVEEQKEFLQYIRFINNQRKRK